MRWREDAITLAGRNLATLSGFVALGLLLLGAEQVRSLFFDLWQCSVWTGLIFLPVVLLPLLGSWLRRRPSGGLVLRTWPTANIFWRGSARHPLGYDVFSANSGIGSLLMLVAASKALLFIAWLSGCALVLLFGVRATPVLQTIGWTVCLFCFMGTGLALLDFWDFLHPAPVRLTFLVVVLGIAALYASTDYSPLALTSMTASAAGYFIYTLRSRRQGWKSLLSVVLVVTLIGVLGSLVEETTEKGEAWTSPPGVSAPATIAAGSWPLPGPEGGRLPPVVVLAASGGGSRAAVLTALALETLAAACLPKVNAASGGPCETFADHLHAISSVSGGSLATAAYVAARLEQRDVAAIDRQMGDDFLRPVLLGALNPAVSRGQALEDYWVKKLGLSHRLSDVARSWNGALRASHPPVPVPLFNSATLDAHAVVLSPLDWHAHVSPVRQAENPYESLERPTWVYYRSSIYSLPDLLPGFDPNLAQGVRASANFPFGFPVVQVATTVALPFSPASLDRLEGPKERVRLTDGGVVSNSGLWTLFHLLSSHASELERRGVILILIDGSKMPEYQGRTRMWDLVNAILDQSPIAANLHETMISLLQTRLHHRLGVVAVALEPTVDNNVYTSWALDSASLSQLEQGFAPKLLKMRSQVESAWLTLQDPAAQLHDIPTRLPLD